MSVISNNTLAGSSGQGGGGGYEIERSLMFNSGDNPYLNRTPSAASNSKTWTISFWFKLGQIGTAKYYFGTDTQFLIESTSTGELQIYNYTNSYDWIFRTTRKLRDLSAWYHLVLSVDTTQATATDRVKIYINGQLETDFTNYNNYPSQNFDSAVNTVTQHSIGTYGTSSTTCYEGYLADVNFIDGQALAASDLGEYDDNNIWQPKKYSGSYGTNGFHLDFSDTSSDSALGTDSSGNGNDWTVNNLNAQHGVMYSTGTVVGAISSAWSNAFDGSILTGAYTYTSVTSTLTLKKPITWSNKFEVYALTYGGSLFVNGSDASPTWSSTPATGQWYDITSIVGASGTLTTVGLSDINNGYYTKLNAIRLDDNIIVESTALTDAFHDSPTNGDPTNDTGVGGELSGNYATLNPLDHSGTIQPTFRDGNLICTGPSAWTTVYSTMAYPKSGKWYFETKLKSDHARTNYYHAAGFCPVGTGTYSDNMISLFDAGDLYEYGPAASPTTTLFSAGTVVLEDVVGWAVDIDNWTYSVYINGTISTISNRAIPFTVGVQLTPVVISYNMDYGHFVYNFGQRPFAYTAPSGYKCLCTANLPDPTIEDGSTAFDTALYGGGAASYTISGLSFSPDLVWSKRRDSTNRHALCDTMRGATKDISSDRNSGERTTPDGLTQFNSDGYVIGDDNGEYGWNGGSTSSFVNWIWDAGSSNTTIAAGSLNSSRYDQSEDWSSKITANGVTIEVTDTMFDGNHPVTPARIFRGTGGVKLTHTFTGVTSIRVACYNYSTWNYFEVNGSSSAVLGTETTSNSLATWNNLTVPADGNVSSIEWGYTSTANYYCSAIEINGRILVNNDITLPNFPSIASTVRANPSAGFSIVSYTATSSTGSIGHGLNAAPAFVLCKRTDSTGDWWAGHVGAGWTEGGYLQVADAFTAGVGWWDDTAPDSDIVTLGTYPTAGSPSATYVAYCFAPVEGYSAFGLWDGNASVNGPFVNTGFTPAFILLKGIGAAHYWAIHDDARDPTNTGDKQFVWANTTGQEYAGYDVDFLSNGFKLRNDGGNWNTTGYGRDEYIYAAFASHPFKTARAR